MNPARRLPAFFRAMLLIGIAALLSPSVPAYATRGQDSATHALIAPGVSAAAAVQSADMPASSATVPQPQQVPVSQPAHAQIAPNQRQIAQQLGRLPLGFTPNVGQVNASVRYVAKSQAGMAFFTPNEVVLAVPNRDKAETHNPITATKAISVSVVRTRFVGANTTPTIEAGTPLPGKANYFLGNDQAKWHTDVSTYGDITYRQLYPGIDLQYAGTDGALKSTYTVAAGADPSAIQWRYTGAKDVQVDAAGNLVITVPPGLVKKIGATEAYTLTEQAPVAWQVIGGQRVAVAVQFAITQNKAVRFSVSAFDRTQPLIIDPILRYGIVFGGALGEGANDIVVNSAGNAYVVGTTSSPTFPGANNSYTASSDAFVAKIAADGTTVLWSSYLGGGDQDVGAGIALDAADNVYVTGSTASTNFPHTSGVVRPALIGTLDAFITKLTSAGALSYSTYIGTDASRDVGRKIAVYRNPDTSVSAAIVGSVGSFEEGSVMGEDVFVTKVNGTGSAIDYTRTFVGSGDDGGRSIAFDAAGNVYIAGTTASLSTSTTPFPTTGGVVQSTSTGSGSDAFVAKLNPSGGTVYSTFLGGTSDDAGSGIAVDSAGRVTVVGSTTSNDFPIPLTIPSYDRQCGTNGCTSIAGDVFVTTLNATGSALTYSTFVGGADYDSASEVAVDPLGTITAIANVGSGFPIVNPIVGSQGTGAFVLKLDPLKNGSSGLLYSTPVLASGSGIISGLAVPVSGSIYVAGDTNSDAFVVKLFDSSLLSNAQTRNAEDCQCHNPPPHWTTIHPVNTRTGNFSTQMTDLAVTTPGAPLAWTRSYASQATGVIVSPLGYGWQHPFGARLIIATDAITVVSGVGNELRFVTQPDGSYRADAGIYSTLTKSGAIYLQTLRDQTVNTFNSTGQLTAVKDPQGNQLTLTYTSGQLTRIADAADATRYLQVGYTSGRVTSVGDGTRTVGYGYNGSGDLTSVTDVMGRATTYTYQGHVLTAIIDAIGRTIETVTYDAYTPTGKVIAQTLENGRTVAFGYLSATTIMTTTGVDGRREVQRFTYGPDNALTGIQTSTRNAASGAQPAAQGVLASGFDASFSPASVVDGQGHATATTYTNTGLPTQQIDALGAITRVRYDSQNRPISTTNALNITTLLRYDTFGNVISTTTGIAPGSTLRATSLYTYTTPTTRHPGGLLAEQSGPDGVRTRYTYDATDKGLVVKTEVAYDTTLKQTSVYTYDAMGRVIQTATGVGTGLSRTDVTDYNADNTIKRTVQNYKNGIFDATKPDEDSITSYGYDKLGRSVAVTDTLGVVTATHYNPGGQVDWTIANLSPLQLDAQGQPVFKPFAVSAPAANVATTYGYDGLGRTVLVTQTGLLTGTFTLASRTFSTIDSRVTRTEYDTLSRPVTVTLNYQPSKPVDQIADINVRTITTYDGAGNVIGQRDALGRWTKTAYDAVNRPITVTLNLQDGNPLTGARDADIQAVTQYDALGRVVKTIDNYVDGQFSVTEPITDRVTLYQYDSLGRVISSTMGVASPPPSGHPELNRLNQTRYDARTGRVLAQRDALGRWVAQRYDALGRVVQTVQNCQNPPTTGTTFACGTASSDTNVSNSTIYDALGRVQDQVNALNQTTRSTYDQLGRTRTTTANYVSSGPSTADTNVVTSQTYDALGRVLTTTDATSQVARMQYDALGRTTVMTDTASRVSRSGYDGLGNLRWQTTPDPTLPNGRLTWFGIDGLGRTTTTIVNYQTGASTAPDQDLRTVTGYDRGGRRLSTTDAKGRVTSFAYDNLDRLTAVTENAITGGCAALPVDRQPCNVITSYQYDRVGNRTAIIRPLDGSTPSIQRFTYDAADNQVSSTDPRNYVTSWTYDAGGRPTQQLDPRGSNYTLTYGYDGLDRRTGISATSSSVLNPITMTYDALGRRTGMTDGSGTTSFTPDALGRITQVQAPNTGIIGYTYNARGERTRLTYPNSGPVIDYTYKPDGQLDQVFQSGTALATYGYDSAGRLQQLQRANGATTTYGYDGADRVKDILTTVGGSTVSQFTYTLDKLGLRTQVQETLPDTSSPTPSPTPSATATGPTSTATRTATPSATATGATATATATSTATATASGATATASPTATPTTGSSTLVKAITFEGGSLTDATTGADSVTGTSIAINSTTPLKGVYSANVPAVTGPQYVRENLTATNTVYVSFYLRVDAIPSTSTQIMGFYASGTRKGNLQLTNAGKLRLRNDSTTIGVDSAVLTVGTTYRVGVRQTIGSGTGILEGFVAIGDAAFGSAFASSSSQTLSGATDNVRVGEIVSDAVAITFDDLTLDTGSMPPPSGGGAPTATATSAPPTATATATGIPVTATPSATATATGVPPTATATPTASATPIGPTATATRTATASATATATTAPSATATTAPSATPTSTGGGSLYYAVDMSVGAYLEAETYTSKVGSLFHSFSDATRSNGAGMETTDANASTASATGATDYLTYDLHVTNGGTVNVYLLSTGPDGDSDSVWLAVDGVSDQQVTTGSTGTWVWKKPSATFSLPTGTHTLTIKNREDGAQVDKIYLTTGSTAPTGLGGTALTPQYGSVVSGWLAAYHPSNESDTVLATSGLDLGGTMALGRRAGPVADAPQARVQAMPATSLSRTLTYQYDGLLRLVGATDSTGSTYSYGYDLGGNRTSATVNGTTTTRTYNAANQVSTWTYDFAGNLLNDGTTTYGYDALNRQTSTGATTNAYNGDGVLVQQGATRYTQDLVAPLSQILGDGTQTYVYGRERLYGQLGAVKNWYASDALGSVRYTMDSAGMPSAPVTYDPWGAVTSGSVPTFGFTGELQQGGLVDLRARWYSTNEGRFGSRDPFAGWDEQPYSRNPYQSFRWQTSAGLATKPYSFHPYQYAYSNPVTHTDPTGLCVPEDDGPRSCDPSFTSGLRNALMYTDHYERQNPRGGQALNLVFDRFPDNALTYQPYDDVAFQSFLDSQGYDVSASIKILTFALIQWRMDYAQQHPGVSIPDSSTLFSAGIALGLAVDGLGCFLGPDTGGGSGGSGFSIGITRERAEHILQGAGRTPGGGHGARFDLGGTLGPEGPNQFEMQPSGKTYFDPSLSDQEILQGIIRIANDPSSYPGGVFPVAKKPGSKFEASGYIGNDQVTVIVKPNGPGVVTAYPTGNKR